MKSPKTERHWRDVTVLSTSVSDSESRTMPGTLWIFSESERRGGRKGGGKIKGEGERGGRTHLRSCINTVIKIFCGFSIF